MFFLFFLRLLVFRFDSALLLPEELDSCEDPDDEDDDAEDIDEDEDSEPDDDDDDLEE